MDITTNFSYSSGKPSCKVSLLLPSSDPPSPMRQGRPNGRRATCSWAWGWAIIGRRPRAWSPRNARGPSPSTTAAPSAKPRTSTSSCGRSEGATSGVQEDRCPHVSAIAAISVAPCPRLVTRGEAARGHHAALSGCWGAMEPLWKAFHNGSYRRNLVMQSMLLQGGSKSLIDQSFQRT